MSEADKLHPSYDLPHKDRLIPDLVSAFGGCLIIKRECYRMVLLFVDVWWCRLDGYKIYNELKKNQMKPHKQ